MEEAKPEPTPEPETAPEPAPAAPAPAPATPVVVAAPGQTTSITGCTPAARESGIDLTTLPEVDLLEESLTVIWIHGKKLEAQLLQQALQGRKDWNY